MPFADVEAAVVIEQQIPPEQSVGSLKQGLVCLPAGKIRAFQIRMPASDALEKELRWQPIGLTDRKLKGEVRKLNLSLCTSWKGIASTKPKGKMSLEILWSVRGLGNEDVTCISSANISFDGDDPRVSDRPMIAAIIASLTEARPCLNGATVG